MVKQGGEAWNNRRDKVVLVRKPSPVPPAVQTISSSRSMTATASERTGMSSFTHSERAFPLGSVLHQGWVHLSLSDKRTRMVHAQTKTRKVNFVNFPERDLKTMVLS